MTDILEKTDEQTKTTDGSGDHDKFAHYVKANAQMDGLLRISPAVALCGKKWYPDDIDLGPGEKYETCPTCKGIYDQMKG
jgi:hypothetical protein